MWNCDDCRVARGMQPAGNINKFRSDVPDVVKKTAAKYVFINLICLGGWCDVYYLMFRSFFAKVSMLGLDDEDSMDKMEISPPPLSPQAPSACVLEPPVSSSSPPPPPSSQSPTVKPGKSQTPSSSSSSPDNEKSRKHASFSLQVWNWNHYFWRILPFPPLRDELFSPQIVGLQMIWNL